MKNMPVHINLSSYAGGGKTTIANYLLNSKYKVFMIPRVTCRPRRINEKNSREYIFVTPEHFEIMKDNGDLFADNPVLLNGKVYNSAVLKKELWPKIPEQTDFIISVFGSKFHEIEINVPNVINVFIDFKDRTILNKRLHLRCLKDNSDYEMKILKNAEYDDQNLKSLFRHIIYNDTTHEECANQIINIFENSKNI